MNILLQFTKNNTKISTVERTSFGEDAVKSYSLQEYAGWYGIAFVGEDDLSNVAVTGVSGCFFAAGGVYTSSKPIIESCDLDEVLKTISGHYLIIQQKKGCAVSIVTDPLLSIPMYIYKDNDSICMSTRLDWLLMQSKRDWNVSWEQIFSFVLNSSYAGRRIFVDDIYLADYGSIYSFSDTGELVSNQYWKPSFSNKSYSDKTDYKTSAAIIEDVVRAIMDKHNKVVIPLTAGVDSRLVLAAALKVDRNKVTTLTHGFTDSNHPDVNVAIQLAKAASVPHKYLESNKIINDVLNISESSSVLHKTLGGQARHNFVYDLMMYDCFDEMGCDLELKGLAGGLFKAKWHSNSPTSKITERYTKLYRNLFGGKAKQALSGLDKKFMKICYEDRPDDIDEKLSLDWLSFAVRFSNRIAPRTFFQINRFNSFNPFYDRKFLDSYLSISVSERENAMIHLKMIEYLSPELVSVPYLFSNKYYLFKNSQPVLVDDDELAKMRLKKYKKSVNRIQHLLMRFLSKIGVDHLVGKQPVPADWEYIKEPFLHNLEPVLDDAKRIFPDELEKITIEDFKINPNMDSRSFRFYSLMKFITYCNSKGVSFK